MGGSKESMRRRFRAHCRIGPIIPLGLVLSGLIIFLSESIGAQTTPHVHSSAQMIDGSVHPELIPDSTAYRFYFIVASEVPNPSEARKKRQLAYLNRIGLQGSDRTNAIKVLETFKATYTDLIAKYNETAQVATENGTMPDSATFYAQRNALVQATRDELKRTLTSQGMGLLDAHVQKEKSHMRVAVKDAQ